MCQKRPSGTSKGAGALGSGSHAVRVPSRPRPWCTNRCPGRAAAARRGVPASPSAHTPRSSHEPCADQLRCQASSSPPGSSDDQPPARVTQRACVSRRADPDPDRGPVRGQQRVASRGSPPQARLDPPRALLQLGQAPTRVHGGVDDREAWRPSWSVSSNGRRRSEASDSFRVRRPEHAAKLSRGFARAAAAVSKQADLVVGEHEAGSPGIDPLAHRAETAESSGPGSIRSTTATARSARRSRPARGRAPRLAPRAALYVPDEDRLHRSTDRITAGPGWLRRPSGTALLVRLAFRLHCRHPAGSLQGLRLPGADRALGSFVESRHPL